ncbi:hypothetical protein D3C78_1975530 [compost metagenome]
MQIVKQLRKLCGLLFQSCDLRIDDRDLPLSGQAFSEKFAGDRGDLPERHAQ